MPGRRVPAPERRIAAKMNPQKKTKITVKYGMMSNSAFMIREALEEAEDYDREKAAASLEKAGLS